MNKPRNRPKNNESKLQANCVRWFRLQYPKYSRLFFAVPNGANVNYSNRKTLVAEGLVRGVCDTVLAVPNETYHGFFIEFKWDKGKLTDDQQAFILEVQKQNYKVMVCRTFDDFFEAVNKYMTTTKY